MEWVWLVRPLAMARLSSRQVPSHAFGQRAYYRGGRRIATKGEGRWDTRKWVAVCERPAPARDYSP